MEHYNCQHKRVEGFKRDLHETAHRNENIVVCQILEMNTTMFSDYVALVALSFWKRLETGTQNKSFQYSKFKL